MSITINDAQLVLNPVRNPVRFEVSTDNAYTGTSDAVYYNATIEQSNMPGNGDTLTIEWNGITQVFTFTFFPDDPNDILVYTTGDADDWNAAHLLPALQANYLLSNDFIINTAPVASIYATFYLTARKPGSEYIPTLTPAGGWAVAGESYTGGLDGALRANFAMVVQLWVEDGYGSGTYTKVLEEAYPVDTASQLQGDVAKVLRTYVAPEYPSAGTVTAAQLTGQFTRFYLRFGEKYGDPAKVESRMEQGDTRWAYLAGRSEHGRITYPDWSDQVLPSGVARFLSAWPNTSEATAKWVLPSQREHLAYIVPEGITSGRLRADIYYHDGTSELSHQIEAIADWDEHELWLAHVGVEARSLRAVHPTKTISHYSIFLTQGSGTTVISERRWFRVRYDHVDTYRQLHYLNSRGGWDTMPLYGPREQALEVDKVVSERSTYGGTTLLGLRDSVTVLNTMNDQLQAGTCLLRPDEMDALKELVASEAVVERVGTELWPVEVLDEKAALRDENEQLAGRVVKYRYALRNTAHS